jgi:hypothetical protein
MVFGNQDAAKIGPKVEESLSKDLKAAQPIPYRTEDGEAGKTSAATVLGDVAGALFGGHSELLFSLIFDIPQPRACQLQANVFRQGVGSYVGGLLYSASLAKPVASEVQLDEPKFLSSAKFSGDPSAAGRLNGAGDLGKRLNKFARVEVELGSLTIKGPHVVRLSPDGSGSRFVVSTLPKPVMMGMSFSLDPAEFCALASAVEAAL